MNFIKPDFKNCNLNISSTIAEFLGIENKNATIKELKDELNKGYKNIIFICFDGLGINPLRINLDKNSFLRKNIVRTLVSTFPSTTTNATTSLATNLLPLEHGWLGWSLHFDEIDKNVDIYMHCISETNNVVDYNYPIADNTDFYFYKNKSLYKVSSIFMPYVNVKDESINHRINNVYDLTKEINNIISDTENKHFIYAYMDNPDATMHTEGVTSNVTKRVISQINDEMEKLYNSVSDTLIIITADHGQVDIDGYVEFYKDNELMDMLECPPFLDGRTPAFNVKKGMKEIFFNKFSERYGRDFELHESQDLIDKGYFGSRGKYGYLLGDFIGIGTYTHKQFLAYEYSPRFKGHHTSLTEEMEVPLIICAKKSL